MICQAIWSLQNILGGGNLLSNLRYLTIPEEVGIGRLVNCQCVLIAGGLLVLMNSDHHKLLMWTSDRDDPCSLIGQSVSILCSDWLLTWGHRSYSAPGLYRGPIVSPDRVDTRKCSDVSISLVRRQQSSSLIGWSTAMLAYDWWTDTLSTRMFLSLNLWWLQSSQG